VKITRIPINSASVVECCVCML